jgi:hypothetical protein
MTDFLIYRSPVFECKGKPGKHAEIAKVKLPRHAGMALIWFNGYNG